MQAFIDDFLKSKSFKDYQGIALIGSYARGDEQPLSDIDLIFISDNPKEHHIEIYQNHYYSLTYYTISQLEAYKKDVHKLLVGMKTFQQMKVIYDPHASLKNIQEAFDSFTWSSNQKTSAKYQAKEALIDYLEEVQKCLSGIKEKHIGKMLNGLYGVSYGMFSVIRLRDQIMIASDNDFYQSVMDHLDDKDPIKILGPLVFNIESVTLMDQLEAGLEIFMHVSNSLIKFCTQEERRYLMKIIQEIIQVI